MSATLRPPAKAWRLSWLVAAYGRYVAIERDLTGSPVDRDATGNRLRDAPGWSGSGSAVYEFQPAAIGRVSVRGDVSWQSRVFFSPFNTPWSRNLRMHWFTDAPRSCRAAAAGKRQCTCATLAVRSLALPASRARNASQATCVLIAVRYPGISRSPVSSASNTRRESISSYS